MDELKIQSLKIWKIEQMKNCKIKKNTENKGNEETVNCDINRENKN